MRKLLVAALAMLLLTPVAARADDGACAGLIGGSSLDAFYRCLAQSNRAQTQQGIDTLARNQQQQNQLLEQQRQGELQQRMNSLLEQQRLDSERQQLGPLAPPPVPQLR